MERFSYCWFILQIATEAKIGPGQKQKPGASSGCPIWVLQDQTLNNLQLLFPFHEQGAGLEVGVNSWGVN